MMTVTGVPSIKKVPGNLIRFDREKDGFVDLTKLSKIELLDLKQREENLLQNRKFLNKLPDKGEKIKKFFLRIEAEVKKRDEHDKLCGLLAKLNVNESKEKLEKLEWTGQYDPDNPPDEIDDGDEVDPLKILATHSGTSKSRDVQVKKEKEETRIKASDIQENDDSDLKNVENFAKDLCSRFDSSKIKESKIKFYTHKFLHATSVKDLVKNEEPEIVPSNSSDNNAKEAKMLSLKESLIVQQRQKEHLKAVEMKHALEKLTNKPGISLSVPENHVHEYREHPVSIDSDDEICSIVSNEHDDDDDEKDTAVFYNLVD